MFEEYTNNYEKNYLIKKYFLGDKRRMYERELRKYIKNLRLSQTKKR